MIQAEAVRLFAEKGYAETTVEEIADAAAISPRTFFRYFPTKEDVVIWDEYDPIALELMASRPSHESPAESFRAIIRQAIEGLYRRDPEGLLVRHRLLQTVPELRARFLEMQGSGAELLATTFAQTRGRLIDELQLRVTAGALASVITVAFDRWQRDNGESDLLALFDQATDALVTGVGQLRQKPRAARG
jgi:AcrR family transcriptional regulator